MTNVKELSPENTINLEAAAWVAKLDSGDMSEAAQTALKAWVSRSPKHKRQLYFLANMWDGIDDMWNEEILSTPEKSELREAFWEKSRGALAMAASIILVFLSLFMINDQGRDEVLNIVYTSHIGEQKIVTLDDGSTISLNTDTQVEILFSKNKRKVRLLKGEALFEVTKDKSRPFLVYAGSGVVRAVGTAFVVQLHAKKVEVTVTEGRVELSTYKQGGGDVDMKEMLAENPQVLATLDAGQYAEFNTVIETIVPIEKEEIERNLSWQHGQVIFDGERLDKVVEDINRYTELEIIVSDAQAKKILISGYFLTSDVKVILRSLETGFGINVEYTESGKVYLSTNI